MSRSDFGDDGSLTTRAVQLFILITLLSLVPGLAIMVTLFSHSSSPYLAILRKRQSVCKQSPPNMLMVTLALFLTYFVMEPVVREGLEQRGSTRWIDGQLTLEQAFPATIDPFSRLHVREDSTREPTSASRACARTSPRPLRARNPCPSSCQHSS